MKCLVEIPQHCFLGSFHAFTIKTVPPPPKTDILYLQLQIIPNTVHYKYHHRLKKPHLIMLIKTPPPIHHACLSQVPGNDLAEGRD